MSRYAKIGRTTWDLRFPAASRLVGVDHGFEFAHEPDCPVQSNMVAACDCYVSRLRLVTTPVGDVLPTTEPDLSTNVRFWHKEAQRWEREAWIARGLFTAVVIGNLVLGWL